MAQTMERCRIALGRLAVHQDRGAPMTVPAYLNLMDELGATRSPSRPRVSNDNPFSEAQFKTQKQQPNYPGRFEGAPATRGRGVPSTGQSKMTPRPP